MIKVTNLWVYPVKSLAGISLSKAKLDRFGIEHDRRWLIVDDSGHFLTQRSHPQMALIGTSIIDNQLHLIINDEFIRVPDVNDINNQILVTVWKDSFYAQPISSHINQLLSKTLGISCQLVYMNSEAQRQIDTQFAPQGQYVSFADAFPFLLTNKASLRALNQHLDKKAEMIRFRPNIVIDGCEAYEEDTLTQFSINQVELIAVKKCSRCPMPTINQKTGIKDNKQILTILNQTRKINNKVYFGQNLIYKNPELIRNLEVNIGDEIILK